LLTLQRTIFPLLSCLILLMLAGCAAESQGPVANVYHNVAARYNAYFLAKSRMDEVEEALRQSQEINFNKLLYIFPEVDSNTVNSVKPQLEDIMKKASIAIERHKHSKWVDDCYILVGKARFYGGEYEHAVETFKYVNVKSKDDNARHLALINLMRTFTDYQELNNAKAVADYLRKETLDKENLRKFNLVRAYYFKQQEDWPQMAAALAEAAPETAKKDGRARLYFVLGQVYQLLEQNDLAYDSFQKSLKSNPDYELSFYARLNMAQVFNLAEKGDEKQIRRYFAKLLKDKKNREYRDKIYYEIGNFEARQDNLEAAIDNYKKSVSASIDNTRQKSYAYLKLAELYYDHYNDYRLAKVYYDSTVASLPNDEASYAQVQQRQEVLEDLVDQLNTIELQDSLLSLVALDSARLRVILTDIVLEEQAQQERQAQLERQRSVNQARNTTFNNATGNFGFGDNAPQNQTGEWYFYNENLLSMGRADFIQNWGERSLQDNWRLKSRSQTESTQVVTQDQQRESFPESTDASTPVLSPAQQVEARVDELYASLPLTAEQQSEALGQIETAYYKMGKLYNYELQETMESIKAFDILNNRFPESEYRPEVLYQLYLLYSKEDPELAQQYKDELISNFPHTTFAKVAINPQYHEETDRATAMLKQVYAKAYALYQEGDYEQADSILRLNLREYPENSFSEHLRLLHILVTGKTEGIHKYRFQLKQYIDHSENERLKEYARELLQASFDLDKQASLDQKDAFQGIRFVEDFSQPHYFLLIYENEKKLADLLITSVDSFNLENHPEAALKATNLILKGNTAMIYVSQFPDRPASMLYFRDFERTMPLPEEAQNAKATFFVISKDNFQLFYDSKDVNEYQKFFTKFYN
jgi:tetratricopeptide (TPR) repeat protein